MSSDENGCVIYKLLPRFERSLLLMHVTFDIVSRASTFSNIPMTRSQLNDVDVLDVICTDFV